MKIRRHLRSEAGHQGEVAWNKTERYDDETARQGIMVDRSKLEKQLLEKFEFKSEVLNGNR